MNDNAILMRMPKQLDSGSTMQSTLNALWDNYQQFKLQQANGGIPHYDAAERYICGYPVPDFQRPLVWTQEQSVRFIESLWLGLNPGSYTVHETEYKPGGFPVPFSGWLIDGQQRLNAVQGYWDDKYPVFGFLWSQLSDVEQRRFLMVKFMHTVAALWDEAAIRELYNRMAFGGVAHQAGQEA